MKNLISRSLSSLKKKKRTRWGHVLNRKKDKRDHRDLMYHAHFRPQETGKKKAAPALPKKIDLFSQVPAILNQGQFGSCTAHGLAGAYQLIEAQQLRAKLVGQPEEFGPQFTLVSRMMIYAGERMMEGTLNQDEGAEVRDGIKYLAQVGVCPEPLFPYTAANLYRAPSPQAVQAAMPHRISSYFRLTSLDDMKHCLASGYPFIFGSYLVSSFESDQVASTGLVPDPLPTEEFIGGHALYCVGYDDSKQMFHVVNSWGTDWGQGGTCWMSYHYLSNPNLTDDIWMIRK
jgi:C1A family cysteine protease